MKREATLHELGEEVRRRYFENWAYFNSSDLGQAIERLLNALPLDVPEENETPADATGSDGA